jgi:hypothetical protein
MQHPSRPRNQRCHFTTHRAHACSRHTSLAPPAGPSCEAAASTAPTPSAASARRPPRLLPPVPRAAAAAASDSHAARQCARSVPRLASHYAHRPLRGARGHDQAHVKQPNPQCGIHAMRHGTQRRAHMRAHTCASLVRARSRSAPSCPDTAFSRSPAQRQHSTSRTVLNVTADTTQPRMQAYECQRRHDRDCYKIERTHFNRACQ